MSTKNAVLSSLGLGALVIGLIALPGSSARPREQAPTASHAKHLPNVAQVVVSEQQQASTPVVSRIEVVSVDDDPAGAPLAGDENVRVFLGPSGSWLGVETSEVTQEKVKALKLPAERGALVGKIIPDSPAAKAGLKENDVITEINGQRVEGTAQFRRMIREIPAGRAVQLTVWRDGRAQTISATLGKAEPHKLGPLVAPSAPGAFAFRMPEMPELSEIPEIGGWNGFSYSIMGQPRLGIDAEDLQGDFGNYFGAPDGEGVLVRDVFKDSPAAKAGLRAGDVITSLGGDRVRNVGELREKLRARKDEKTVKLGLLRNKSELSVTVELPAPQEMKSHHTSERTRI